MEHIKQLGMVFWISTILVISFVFWGFTSPNQLENTAQVIFDFTTNAFGGFYLLLIGFFIIFILVLATSQYGNIKLGHDDDEPQYSFYNWIGMLFSAGFGISLVFWGVSEPMKHYMAPPMDIEPQSVKAASIAIQYAMFHWGIHQWAVFSVVGLCIGYFHFRRKQTFLISTTLMPLFNEKIRENKSWQMGVDVLAVVATATGVATSLGLGVLQVNSGLNWVFDIPESTKSQLTIILIMLVMYQISSITGLNKGIRILSNVNLTIAFFLMVFVFLVGPTSFLSNVFVSGLGNYLSEMINMSFHLTPFTQKTWVKDWTLFYWAWAIAWSPFVGTFIARVSKGRTIREFVLAVLFVPALVAIMWMAVFGGSALYFEMFQGVPILEAVQTNVASGLFITLEHFPFGSLLSIIAIILIFIFLVTSADSSTFVLGMMTTNGQTNPSIGVKIIWGVSQSAIAIILLFSSGLKGLQTASLITALPFSMIMIGMCISLFKSIRQEYFYNQDQSRS